VNESNSDILTEKNAADGAQDNFSHFSSMDNFDRTDERRLHLQAFDYWHALKSQRDYPLFSELRAEDLNPFKDSSLLLEFNQNGTAVRFLGESVGELVDAPLKVGNYLADFPDSDFSRALLDQFSKEEARAQAAEFEFLENHLSCRGVMLPFSRDGSGPHFVLLVASFRKHAQTDDTHISAVSETVGTTKNPTKGESSNVLSGLLSAGKRAADGIAHMDNGNRTSLYVALASALNLFERATRNPEAYNSLLREHGVRSQARAPYTPILKLVFGAGYDKTRLTEYAAALSFAVRMGETSANFVEFLKATPGGIKGCVQQERAFKRGADGTPTHARQVEAESILRRMPATALADIAPIAPAEEFCVLLARRGDGVLEVLGQAEIPNSTLDAAIRKMASHRKSE